VVTGFVSADEVARVLTYEALIPAMARALTAFSAGKVLQPVRAILSAEHGFFGVMPALYNGVLGAKLVTVFPGNPAHGLPGHQAIIQLFDGANGTPLGTLDGRVITEMRTAAVSAVAADHLAPRDAHVLAILGSGVQARAHIKALRLVRPIDEIRIWNRTTSSAARLAAEVGGRVTSAEAAVRGADIVVTVTHAPDPVLQGSWLSDHAFVAAVGAVGRANRELDSAAMRGPIVVDSRAAAATESGDIIQANATIYAELGEILAGTVAAPVGGPVVFKSLGLAVEDLAAAELVIEALSPH
jgi:ornithine cyclodeaminase/alanine dehydrogenase-like protein (mu-crystallin family)